MKNPKAILFFGSLFSLGIPTGTGMHELAHVIAAVGFQSFLIFHGYALLFSSRAVTKVYLNLHRWLEGAFAMGFGAASFKVFTAKVQAP